MASQNAQSLVHSNDLEGNAVLGRRGEEIGTLDHLVIDGESGKVAYAVVAFGGILGLGEDTFPLPWGSVTFDPESQTFRADVTRDQLEGAPERPGDWPKNRQWEERTFAHFGVPPYWS